MLAMTYDQWSKNDSVVYPCISQPKLDGWRCMASKTGLFSREGNRFTNLAHIEAALAAFFAQNPDVILDGELYRHGLSLGEIAGILSAKSGTTEAIQFHIFGIATAHRDLTLPPSDSVRQVESAICNTRGELNRACKRYLADGYEGQIIRHKDFTYKQGRSSTLLKRKHVYDKKDAERVYRNFAAAFAAV